MKLNITIDLSKIPAGEGDLKEALMKAGKTLEKAAAQMKNGSFDSLIGLFHKSVTVELFSDNVKVGKITTK